MDNRGDARFTCFYGWWSRTIRISICNINSFAKKKKLICLSNSIYRIQWICECRHSPIQTAAYVRQSAELLTVHTKLVFCKLTFMHFQKIPLIWISLYRLAENQVSRTTRTVHNPIPSSVRRHTTLLSIYMRHTCEWNKKKSCRYRDRGREREQKALLSVTIK